MVLKTANNNYHTTIADLGIACHQELARHNITLVNAVNLCAFVGPNRLVDR